MLAFRLNAAFSRKASVEKLPGYEPDGCGIRPSCMSSETWS